MCLVHMIEHDVKRRQDAMAAVLFQGVTKDEGILSSYLTFHSYISLAKGNISQ